MDRVPRRRLPCVVVCWGHRLLHPHVALLLRPLALKLELDRMDSFRHDARMRVRCCRIKRLRRSEVEQEGNGWWWLARPSTVCSDRLSALDLVSPLWSTCCPAMTHARLSTDSVILRPSECLLVPLTRPPIPHMRAQGWLDRGPSPCSRHTSKRAYIRDCGDATSCDVIAPSGRGKRLIS